MAPFFQVSDDNKTLYVFRSDPSGRPRQLVEIDLNSRRVKSVIHEFEEDGASLQLSPDGNTLAVVTAGDSKTSLARVDVTGDNYLELHPAPNPKAVQVSPQLAWTKDGLGILFALEEPVTHDLPAWGFRDADVLTRQRIWHVDADGATPATFTEVEVQFKRLQQISLNPDGSRLAIGLARGGRELWELDLSAVLAGPK
jgi:Tol biopolymer transport system component